MQTSGDRKPETYESYFAGVSEPPFAHGCDSSQAENALVAATIARISRDCAGRYAGFADAVRDLVVAAVKHLDEIGFRIGGRTQWLHIASTLRLTCYRVSPRLTIPSSCA